MENITIKYGKGESITTNDIMQKIESACYAHGLENGLQDLHNVKSGQFSNILRDVGHGFIKPLNILKLDNKLNVYDIDKLKLMLELYIYICIEYDKYIYINGFYNLCGLSDRYMNDSNNSNVSNQFHLYASKRIEQADNERMQERATDSKQAILNIAYGNYRHNWNGQIKSNEINATAKSLTDLRNNILGIASNNE